jgi:putative membrane protein
MLFVGLIIMRVGFKGQNILWTTNIFLGVQVILTILYLSQFLRTQKIIIITLSIFLLSFLVELVGVKTGFPFGNYSYTDALNPKIFGVSIAIIFAWFALTVNTFVLTRSFIDGSILKTALISGFIILSIDFLLEPFASSVNKFWLWESYEIPLQNYAAWFILGFLFSLIIYKVIGPDLMKTSYKQNLWVSLVILGSNIMLFSLINMLFGFLVNTILGLILITLVILLTFRASLYEV